jgi:hypothetical protein
METMKTKEGLLRVGYIKITRWAVNHNDGSVFVFNTQRDAYRFARLENGGQFPEYSKTVFQLEYYEKPPGISEILCNLKSKMEVIAKEGIKTLPCCTEGKCDWVTGGGLMLCLTCGETQ